MSPDRLSNPGPLTYESGALPIALRGLAAVLMIKFEILSKTSTSTNASLLEPVGII